jgi:hypothetical protein
VSAKQFIAALAEAICTGPNTDKFNESECHGYAVEVLTGDDPMEVLGAAVKAPPERVGLFAGTQNFRTRSSLCARSKQAALTDYAPWRRPNARDFD